MISQFSSSSPYLSSGRGPDAPASLAQVGEPVVAIGCWVWRPGSAAQEGGRGEDNPAVPAPPPHTADTRCGDTAGARAASPAPHTGGSAAPAPYSSCWTEEERVTHRLSHCGNIITSSSSSCGSSPGPRKTDKVLRYILNKTVFYIKLD